MDEGRRTLQLPPFPSSISGYFHHHWTCMLLLLSKHIPFPSCVVRTYVYGAQPASSYSSLPIFLMQSVGSKKTRGRVASEELLCSITLTIYSAPFHAPLRIRSIYLSPAASLSGCYVYIAAAIEAIIAHVAAVNEITVQQQPSCVLLPLSFLLQSIMKGHGEC